jgi:guanylate kinase
MKNKGVAFILSAPSGAGKSSIAKKLIKENSVWLSVSVTTRPKRTYEIEGEDYHFITKSLYKKMYEEQQLLESATVYDHSYGTPKKAVLDRLDQGIDVLFDIDWRGAKILKSLDQFKVVSIFILPPSLQELQSRLIKRGDNLETINNRMLIAKEECEHYLEYDYVLINNDFEETLQNVAAILLSAKSMLAKSYFQKFISSPEFNKYTQTK